MEPGSRVEDEFEKRLGQALEEDAYSRPLLLRANDLQARITRSRRSEVTRWLSPAATGAGAALLVVVALNLRGDAPPATVQHGASSDVGSHLPQFPRDSSGISPLAAARGELAYDNNGCLVVHTEHGGATLVLVWPSPGTEWDPTTGTVTVDAVSASVGSRISAGGGVGYVAPTDYEHWISPPAAACQRDHYFFVYALVPTN